MCLYCGRDDSGNCLLMQRDEAFKDKNALYMDSYLWATGDEPHISVGVCLFDRDIMSARFPVNYCPMCGRKLAEASYVGEWISVNEKLPENGSICLVCGAKGGIRVARFRSVRAEWTIVGTGKYFNATHWMELPAPPSD